MWSLEGDGVDAGDGHPSRSRGVMGSEKGAIDHRAFFVLLNQVKKISTRRVAASK
jgi:hypothetical protein